MSKGGKLLGEKSMAINYVEQECPGCGELKVFQEFTSFTGLIRRCMECGFEEVEMSEPPTEPPDMWDIINS